MGLVDFLSIQMVFAFADKFQNASKEIRWLVFSWHWGVSFLSNVLHFEDFLEVFDWQLLEANDRSDESSCDAGIRVSVSS